MPQNTGGFTGVDTKQVSDDSVLIVGIDPNTDPASIIDDNGRSRKNYTLSETEGVTEWSKSYPEVKAVDNSGAHHGGTYSVIAMNKFAVDAGAGGIGLTSSGNITLMGLGGIVNVVAESQVEILSEIVKVDSTSFIILNGPILDINCDKVTVKNLAIFASNAVVNGGLFVKGELFTSHITGMRGKYYTEYALPQATYFSPSVKIKGLMTLSSLIPGPWMPPSTVCMVDLILPSPEMYMFKSGYILPHRHRFYHLAADLCSSPLDVWSESVAIESAKGPLAPKSAAGSIFSDIKGYATRKIKALTKSIVKQLLG